MTRHTISGRTGGTRRALVLVAALTTGGLVAGCSSPGPVASVSSAGGPSRVSSGPATAPRVSTGSATTAKNNGHILRTEYMSVDAPLEVDVLALGRVNQSVVGLRLRVTNVGTDSADILGLWTESPNSGTSGMDAGEPFGALKLVSGSTMKQYKPLTNVSDSSVLQAGYTPDKFDFKAGESFTATILYPAPPASVRVLTLTSGETTPLVDLPIASSFPSRPGDPDPGAKVNTPDIEPLTQRSDALNKVSSLDNNGGKVDVRLSADVLFAYNKYSLTAASDTALRQVAARIDASTARTIHVDGYTDSSGADAHNQTLSKQRAQSALSRLKTLVHRHGIRWQAAGHGPADPVADNGTPAGRQKNRRVTVTIG